MTLTFLSSTASAIRFSDTNWLDVLIAVIIGVFSAGGIVAFMKLKSENTKILVDAAQGAVVVQSGVIETLRSDLQSAHAEINELRSHITELNLLRGRVRELEHDNEILKLENSRLSTQVEGLKTLVRRSINGGSDAL